MRTTLDIDDDVLQAAEELGALLNDSLFDLSRIGGHRHSTDVYLLGLAQSRGGRLVTFDRTIPVRAVTGASTDSLEVIAPAE